MNTKSKPFSRVVEFLSACFLTDSVFAMGAERARAVLKNRIGHALDREAYSEALPSFELLERHDGFLNESMNYRFIVALDKGGNPPEARRRAVLHIGRFGVDCLHGENLYALITGKKKTWDVTGNTQEVMMSLHIHSKALHKVARAMNVTVERLAEYGRREPSANEALAFSALRVDAYLLRARGASEDDIAQATAWFESLCRREPTLSVVHSA